jgi:hypothetical protein
MAFRPPADTAGHVAPAGGRMAAGKNELAQTRQLRIHSIDGLFQKKGIFTGEIPGGLEGRVVTGRGQAGPDAEQVALDLMKFPDPVAAIAWQRDNNRTQKRIQFIDIPVSFYAHIIFRDAFTAEQAGLSAVTTAGVYFHVTSSLLPCCVNIR